ncbi:MAG TPA: CARDB domain-containing protein [Humisphaera sp.]
MRHAITEPLEPRRLLAADLAVSAVAANVPAEAIVGLKVKASPVVTVTNLGDETFRGRTTVELFLSADHEFDPSDVPLLTTTAKLKLAPGKTKAIKLKVRAFPDAADGEYHVVACANGDGAVVEADFSDNVAVDELNHVALARPRMDLTAAFNTVPAEARRGKSVSLTVDVGNIANVPATGRVTFAIAASTDTEVDAVGTPLAVAAAKIKVQPDGIGTVKLKFKVPAEFPAGTYFLVGTVDSTNVLAETDEANNGFPGFSTITIG